MITKVQLRNILYSVYEFGYYAGGGTCNSITKTYKKKRKEIVDRILKKAKVC